MTQLDTNVLIYAFEPASPFHQWSRATISEAVAGGGAAINAIILAELCVGEASPDLVPEKIRSRGIHILDVPAPAATACAKAFRLYRQRRESESGPMASAIPLPDFFIGAHAATVACPLATADKGRFGQYFPEVVLITPHHGET